MPRTSIRARKYPNRKAQYITSRAMARSAVVSANRAASYAKASTGEFKSVDVSLDSLGVDTTGTVSLLNGVGRGTDIDEREGREVNMRSVQLRYIVYTNTEAASDQWGRVILVYDRQSNGTAPAITDVLQTNSITAMRNLENRKRFKIFMDKTFVINASYQTAAALNTASNNHFFEEYYRKLSHPVTFNSGTAGTIADITTGSMYLITMGTAATGTTSSLCGLKSRIRYTDK